MISFWERNSLTKADIIIIGAGITGLSTACSIKEKNPGKNVLVLERGIFPTGASTKNAGFACFAKACEMLADVKLADIEWVAQMALKRKTGLDKLRKRLGDKTIDYKQNGGYELIFDDDEHFDPTQIEDLNIELEQYFEMPVFYMRDDLIPRFGFAQTKHLVYTPLEGQVDSGLLMNALGKYATSLGVQLIYGAEVIEFDEDEDGISVFVHHKQMHQNIEFRCQKMALCTNAFTGDFLPDLGIQPGRGQVVITKPIENLKFKGTFHFEEGFFYFRDYYDRILFGGGRNMDFDTERSTEFADNKYILDELRYLLEDVIIPGTEFEIDTNWQGIMGFTPDKKPIIKKITENIVVGFGCNGMGVALASHTGEEVTRLLLE